ncbi:hypothetical protein H4R35_005890 [Dimargaris xerosporica]|nr:hypothetical protein H4R35_005890 [Dimargaris xerosporica]
MKAAILILHAVLLGIVLASPTLQPTTSPKEQEYKNCMERRKNKGTAWGDLMAVGEVLTGTVAYNNEECAHIIDEHDHQSN